MFLEKLVQNRDVEMSLDKELAKQRDYQAAYRFALGNLENIFPNMYYFLKLPKIYEPRLKITSLETNKTH